MNKAAMSSHFFDRIVLVVGEICLQLDSGGPNKPLRRLRMADYPPSSFAKRAVVAVTCRKSGIREQSENKKPIVICVWEMPSTATAVSYLELYQPAAC